MQPRHKFKRITNTARPRCLALLLFTALAPTTLSTAEAQTAPIVQIAPTPARQLTPPRAADGRAVRPSQRIKEAEERAERTKEAFEEYKTHTNWMLVLMSFLLGLVGLVLPVIIYFTSVLPGNRVIDEAKRVLAGLDERFAELAAKHQGRLIDEAISQLANAQEFVRQSAATHLHQNARYNFSENQIFDIFRAVDGATTVVRNLLLDALAQQRSQQVTEFFVRTLDRADAATLVNSLLKHLSLTGSNRLRTKLKEWLLSTPENRKQLLVILLQAALVSPAELTALADDEHFLNKLERGRDAVSQPKR